MTDHTNDQRPGSTVAVWLIVVLTLLPVLYVLSTGPAVWLQDNGYVSNSSLVIYWPLEMACRNCKPIRRTFEVYLSLWGRNPRVA
jgi:hypothetical protein